MPSNYDDFGFGEESTPSEDEYPEVETDAGTIAFLDQQEAQFASNREKWVERYGFDHECRCSQDYTEGRVGEVTQCFMKLMSQALARCSEATHEIRVYTAMMDELLAMNNDLVKMMEDLGHEKELQEYFNEVMELQDDAISQMELQFADEDIIDVEPVDPIDPELEDEDAS